MSSILRELYYNPESGFTGVEKLYRKAKEQNPNISKKEVSEFVKKQKLAQVFMQPRVQRATFTITGQRDHYQSDLTFFEQYKRYNSNHSIILTLIEINTKKAYCVALKNKNADSMLEGFKELVQVLLSENKAIAVLQTDNGTEYTNKTLQDYFESEGIVHSLCQKDDKKCMGVAERFNRTLKGMINKYLEQNSTSKWIDILPKIVNNYNNSYHTSIKMAPNLVGQVEVNSIISEKKEQNENAMERIARNKINVGDKVRLPVKRSLFQKEGKTFSDIIYSVEKVNNKSIVVNGSDVRYPIDKVLKIGESQEGPQPSRLLQTTKPEKAKKEAKTNRIVKREGLDERNVIIGKRRTTPTLTSRGS